MAKDPAFLFYTSDFLTGTMFMSNEQLGIYIRLLCSQHQHGGIIDKISFNSLTNGNELLKSKFIETETGFYNERLTIEMEKRNKKSNNLSETAKDVWAKRKLSKNTIVQENDTIVIQSYNNRNTKVKKNDAIVIRTVNENEDKDIIINKDLNEFEKKLIEFYNFRKQMKKPILNASKEQFLNKLGILSKNNESIAIDILNQSIANGWQGIFELKNNKTKIKDGKSKFDRIFNA